MDSFCSFSIGIYSREQPYIAFCNYQSNTLQFPLKMLNGLSSSIDVSKDSVDCDGSDLEALQCFTEVKSLIIGALAVLGSLPWNI